MHNNEITREIIHGVDLLISVDIALHKTGLLLLSKQGDVLYSEVIKVKAHWRYYRKIDYLYEYFSQLFDSILSFEPKTAILLLEGRLKAGFSGNSLASIEGARITSYLAYYSSCKRHEMDVDLAVYDPQKIKQHFTGRRNANKELMLKDFTSQFSSYSGLDYQEDIFDALYLGIYHLKRKE